MRTRAITLAGLFIILATAARADNIFYVNQCRVLDTRNLGGPLAAGIGYSFAVRGQVGQIQGGTANCGIPEEASGVMIVLTSTGASGAGHLEVYPAQNPPSSPTARLSYSAGLNIADEVLVRLQSFNANQNDVAVKPAVSATHLVADVVAYTVASPRQRPFLTFADAPFAPGAVSPGDTFIVRNGIGAFAGHDNQWVAWTGSGWIFYTPFDGDLAYEVATGTYYRYRATAIPGWAGIGP